MRASHDLTRASISFDEDNLVPNAGAVRAYYRCDGLSNARTASMSRRSATPTATRPGRVFDHDAFEPLGHWEVYDFWWHVGHDVMLSRPGVCATPPP